MHSHNIYFDHGTRVSLGRWSQGPTEGAEEAQMEDELGPD